MRRRLIVGAGLILLLAAGIVLAVPASRYRLLALAQNERLHEGRPAWFWIGALDDDDAEVRRHAALVLGDVCAAKESANAQRDRVVAALIGVLDDRDGFVRKCAATSLLMAPKEAEAPRDRRSIERMAAVLQDKEIAVRRAAVRCLWQAGPAAKEADGVAKLTEALSDADEFVRAYACRALGKLGPDAKPAVPALLARLRDDEQADVRKLAGKTLGLIGAEALGPLRADVTAGLAEGLSHPSRGFREYAARALGQLGAKDAIPALRLAAKDRDEQVRAAAAEALKRLDSDDRPPR